MKKVSLIAAIIFVANCPLYATTIQSTSFLPGPINLTFDDPGQVVLADHTVVTNQFQPQGVNFSGIYYNPIGANGAAQVGEPNSTGNDVGDFFSNGPVHNPHYIEFVNPLTGLASPVSSADFSLATQPATATISALLGGSNGVVVESFSPTTSLSQPNNIFGFTGIVFDTIKIFITPNPNAATQDHADLIDNIQFTAVPEPSSLILAGLGVVGLFAVARRRRKA